MNFIYAIQHCQEKCIGIKIDSQFGMTNVQVQLPFDEKELRKFELSVIKSIPIINFGQKSKVLLQHPGGCQKYLRCCIIVVNLNIFLKKIKQLK